MARNVIVFLVALVVGLGLAYLLLGDHGKGGGFPGIGRHEEGADGGDPRAEDADRSKDILDTQPETRGPVLFGRPRAERVGVGGLAGRVADAEDDAAIAGATLLLAGVGFGDEEVQRRGETSEDGAFHLAEVPAGDDYTLRVSAEGKPERVWTGASIRDGAVTRLGTIWLGEQIPFEGRVVDASGLGVARADVRVFVGHFSLEELMGRLDELFAELDREPVPNARTLTESGGRFAFPKLDPGPITLTVRAPGFVPAFLAVVVAPASKTTKPIVVRLRPGSAIAGQVVDPSGRGISGARICAMADQDPRSFWIGRSFVETLGDGSFRVDTAGSDRVQIMTTYPGYPLVISRVKAGDENVKIVMERGCRLTVRILDDADGEPVEGAMVMLSTSKSGRVNEEGQSLSTGKTDRAGQIRFDVKPGKLQMVMVTHPVRPAAMWMGGGMGAMVPGMMKGPEDPVVPKGRREVTFRMQDTLTVRGRVTDASGTAISDAEVRAFGGFQFGRSVRVAEDGAYEVAVAGSQFGGALVARAPGYVKLNVGINIREAKDGVLQKDIQLVRAAVVSGRVLDENGQPVAGAQVKVDAGAGNPMRFAMAMAGEVKGVSGKSGRYVLDAVPPGEKVRILAHRPGYVDAASERFAVSPGGSVTGKDVTLLQGATIEVTVEDPTGRPLAGATVEFAYDREDEVAWDATEMFMGRAPRTTDVHGRVLEEDVPAGEVTISASHEKSASAQVKLKVSAEASAALDTTVRLRRPVTIEGIVLDAQGAPHRGATVVTGGRGGTWISDQTGEDGRFRLERVPEGRVTLRVSGAAGHRNHSVDIDGPNPDLVIRLEARDMSKEPRRDAVLQRLGELGQEMQNAENDEQREALTKEIQALQEELGELMTEAQPADADPEPVPPEPVKEDED